MRTRRFMVLVALLTTFVCEARANLIQNGDAETGDLSGWTDALGNGYSISSGRIFEGEHAFQGGLHGPAGPYQNEIRQDVDLSAFATEIDQGGAIAMFRGFAFSASEAGNTDHAFIIVEYRDSGGALLGSYDSGAVGPINEWVPVEDSRSLPVGTRVARIRLRSTRDIGLSTDGYHDGLSLEIQTSSAVDAPEDGLATLPRLGATFPNPCTSGASIPLDIPQSVSADLRIYTSSGRLVRALLSGSELGSGRHVVHWDGRGDSGAPLPSGRYFILLRTHGTSDARMITIVQ